MSSENMFQSKVEKEIKQRIRKVNKELDELRIEEEELTRAYDGYTRFYDDLCLFISKNMENFSLSEDELPYYFRSNINTVYYEYVQIRVDAIEEVEIIEKYIEKNRKNKSSTLRTLKFFKSQYMDSDFYETCNPLIKLYEKQLCIYDKNEEYCVKIIDVLSKVIEKLAQWT